MKPANAAGEPVAPLFEGLPSGPRRASDAEVARHRRERLLGAMLAAVTRHGYAGVTLGELVALAGLSKSTFYELFESKEECFFAAFDEIVEQDARLVWEAYERGTDLRERLLRALRAYGELVAARPESAAFVIVESLELGTAGAPRRERGIERFEQVLRRALERERDGGMSELAIRGVLGGGRRVAYRRLREGCPERFGEHAEELLDWALVYRGHNERRVGEPSPAKPVAGEPGVRADEAEGPPGWDEPPSSARSRATLSQRERIMRAVAQLAGQRGYAGLSVPAISGAAGVSNQTFYQEFGGKQEACLAAFDALTARALELTAAIFTRRRDLAEAVNTWLRATLSMIAANPVLARFVFFEVAAAGPVGRDVAELTVERAMAFLAPGALPAGTEPLPEVVVEAIGGGIWTIIQHEIIHGRTEALPRLAPTLLDFILVPLGFD